ncbi:TRAP transporter large permease subunit [Chloroflexota bacterium]
MDIGTITLIIVVTLLAVIVTGFPVAFSLLFVSIIGIIVWIKPAALISLASVTFSLTTKDYFIALPMFIYMACLLTVSGLGSALYEMMYKWMAGLRGGLAMGTVGISAFMAAMTGAAATATVTMGLFAYPEMMKRGYSKDIAIGCIPAGGCLGPLIPPSIPMIVVAALTTVSIGKLFIAGILPGLLMTLLFILYIGIRCLLNPKLGPPIPIAERASWKDKIKSLRLAGLPVVIIFSVLGLIYLGICTPSEAGGIGAFGALLCTAVNRRLNRKNLKEAGMTALRVTSMLYMTMIGGICFSTLCTITGVTRFVSQILIGVAAEPLVILFVILGIVYVMGMFMDATAITIICIPIFVPVILALGYDILWFCLLFVIDLIIGFVSPPYGIVAFYFLGLGHPGVTINDVYRAVLPFVVIMTIGLIICVFYPPIVTWLPSLMIK